MARFSAVKKDLIVSKEEANTEALKGLSVASMRSMHLYFFHSAVNAVEVICMWKRAVWRKVIIYGRGDHIYFHAVVCSSSFFFFFLA